MTALLWPELGPEEIEDGWLPDVPRVTSDDVATALARRHANVAVADAPSHWAFAREVQSTTGSYQEAQRFDAVAIGLVPSNGYARVVYEIKVSRADWLRELRPRVDRFVTSHYEEPAEGEWYDGRWVTEVKRVERAGRKWDAALEISTEFWIAAPPRCVLPDELPPEAGLVEVRPWGPKRELRARVVRQAPKRLTPMPDAGFWAAVIRQVVRGERRSGQ